MSTTRGSLRWEPTERAYKAIGKEKPRFHSKGGYLHQFLAQRIREWGESSGYAADMEFMLSNRKAVDLVLRKCEEVLFVEVGISPPIDKEIQNLIKDFGTRLQPDKVIIAAKDGGMRRRLIEMIGADNRLKEYSEKIKVTLAGDFLVKDKNPIY